MMVLVVIANCQVLSVDKKLYLLINLLLAWKKIDTFRSASYTLISYHLSLS